MDKEFSWRSINQGRIIFYVVRINNMKSLIYCIKYYSRVNIAPYLGHVLQNFITSSMYEQTFLKVDFLRRQTPSKTKI